MTTQHSRAIDQGKDSPRSIEHADGAQSAGNGELQATSPRNDGAAAINERELWHQKLDECQETARNSLDLEQRSNEALYLALARAYVWWHQVGGHDAEFYKALLKEKSIPAKNVKRKFAALVRLVFRLGTPADDEVRKEREKKQVSRLATALDAIHARFNDETIAFGSMSEDAIVTFIQENRGVEKLQQSQLDAERDRQTSDDNEEDSTRLKALQEGERYFRSKEKLADFRVSSLSDVEGALVPVLGRIGTNNTVDVVAILRRKQNLLEQLLEEGADVSNLHPALSLISEVTDLAEVIDEHNTRQPTRQDADPNAKPTKFKRSLRTVIVRHGRTEPKILVGLNLSQSGVVLRADPKVEFELPVDLDVFVDNRSRRTFEAEVRPPSTRRFCSCQIVPSADNERSKARLVITNAVTKDTHNLLFFDYASYAADVLDVDLAGVNWAVTLTLTRSEFLEINEHYLKPFGRLRKVKPLVLRFASDGLHLCYPGAEERHFSLQTGLKRNGEVRLTVLGQDLVMLGEKLSEVETTDNIGLQCDPAGVLEVTAQTALASYAFYVPALLDDGETRNPKRFAPYPKIGGVEKADPGAAGLAEAAD